MNVIFKPWNKNLHNEDEKRTDSIDAIIYVLNINISAGDKCNFSSLK